MSNLYSKDMYPSDPNRPDRRKHRHTSRLLGAVLISIALVVVSVPVILTLIPIRDTTSKIGDKYKEFHTTGKIIRHRCYLDESGKVCMSYTIGVRFKINNRLFVEEFNVTPSQHDYYVSGDSTVPIGLVVLDETDTKAKCMYVINNSDAHVTWFDKRRQEWRMIHGWE